MNTNSSRHFEQLIAGIDQGIEAHLAWNQRLMRCSLLHESPGEEMLLPDAHRRCVFGKWFVQEKASLSAFDAGLTDTVEREHQAMHDAVRALCKASSLGRAATLDAFQAYEAGQSGMVSALNVLRQKVAESVLQHDALTGLPLRHGLAFAFDWRRRDAARQAVPLHLAMVDVDHFKSINDTHGHAVGDQALQHLTRLMTNGLRENDIVIRFGGEEFLFLLLGHGAETVVQRLLERIRGTPMARGEGPPLRLTVTAGLTHVALADTLEQAVQRADKALLEGKLHGRDRYVLA